MKLENYKLVMSILIVTLILAIGNIAFAKEDKKDDGKITITPTDSLIVDGDAANKQHVNTAPVNKVTNTVKNTTIKTNTESLPKTGENDIYIVSALGVICLVTAVYAYSKIRNY